MRSQLDCHDSRLPGTGVFDIKTRAVLPIRMDILNYEENSGYQIRSQYGIMESFEREYYDLIRSGFLKYRCAVCVSSGSECALTRRGMKCASAYWEHGRRDGYVPQYGAHFWIPVHLARRDGRADIRACAGHWGEGLQ